MKAKQVLTLIAAFALAACGSDTMLPTEASLPGALSAGAAEVVGSEAPEIDEEPILSTMAPSKGNSGKGKPGNVTESFVVPGTADDGSKGGSGPAATGFILKPGLPVTVTATGTVERKSSGGENIGPGGNDNPFCAGGIGCITTACPDISLVAKVGDGPFQCVGAGPTELAGSGELKFYVNDNAHGDNSGAWTAEVEYECFPGNGNGDKNHYHCGPPGRNMSH